MKLLIILLAFQTAIVPGDGKKNGRKGNIEFEAGRFDQAIAAYRSGIEGVRSEGPGTVHAGLLNNLGAAHFQQGEFEQAGTAFTNSMRMAVSPEERARGAYNAGNSAVMAQQLEQALGFYKQAIMDDPANEDARFNYEFAKRMLQNQQQQQQQQQNQNQNDQENQDQNEGEQNQENQDQENQDNQQQPPPEPDDSEGENQQPEQSPEEQNPEELSQEEAERILQALQNEEEQLLRQIQKMKTRPRRVDKDW